MPRSWYAILYHTLVNFGFNSSECDHSLLIYNYHKVTLYARVYVDDILIISSSSKLIHELIEKLHTKFARKKLGVPQYFLGIEVHHQANVTLLLTQTKYIHDLMSKFHMMEAKGVATPMFSLCKQSKHGTDVMTDPLLYHSIVRALQ